jgi:hypothetical protein
VSKCKLDSIGSGLGLTYNLREHSKKLPESISRGNTLSSSTTISFSRMTLLVRHSIFQYLVSVTCGLEEIYFIDSSSFFKLSASMQQLVNGKVC